MEFLQHILTHWQEILIAGAAALGAFAAFLAALYAFFLLIPGDQPDKAIKFLLDLTKRISRKPMSFILAAAIMLSLSACGVTERARQIHSTASTEGAQAADAFLEGNMKELCQWATIGSLERRFGDNPEMYRKYHELCAHKAPINQ